MTMNNLRYIAIDLKSFYASVECVERGLDPLTTNLVVADESRTEKTICLAVSPTLKSYGISGRARLFEVIQKIDEINRTNSSKKIEFIIARPRMALYLEYSAKIYEIYLKYIAPEDIHSYSVDEVFIDASGYSKVYDMTIEELTEQMMKDVLENTGITSTAGIGSNLYLAKIAMDIWAKRMLPDKHGFRIASLDEMSYRENLWSHRPITDFWRIGKGYAKRLADHGLYTMGDVARCSVGSEDNYHNEELLYDVFGINAELLIDHAWGWEPCTIADIKSYKPDNNSISSGQVLQEPYDYEKGRLVVWEMAQGVALELTDKKLVCNQLVLTVGYDISNLTQENIKKNYHGEVTVDHYGRQVPKHAHGTANLNEYSCSAKLISESVCKLYDNIIDRNLLIRRFNISANHVIEKTDDRNEYRQLDFFSSFDDIEKKKKEAILQDVMINVKNRYGKNAILKGSNLEDGATAVSRNRQIGGHRA